MSSTRRDPVIQTPRETQITDVTQGRHTVCMDLTTHKLPATAECIVLGQVPLGHWIDHTIENCHIVSQGSAVLVVVDAAQSVPVVVVHLLDNLTLDEHKPGWAVEHLSKPLDERSILILEIQNQTRTDSRWVAVVTRLDGVGSLVPHNRLFGICRDRNVMTRIYESHDRLWVEMDVGIDKHEVILLILQKEARDRQIARPLNQRLIFGCV